jgi:hypothetical protein
MSWEHHKEQCVVIFGGIVKNFDCNVTGEEKHITPFECIAYAAWLP